MIACSFYLSFSHNHSTPIQIPKIFFEICTASKYLHDINIYKTTNQFIMKRKRAYFSSRIPLYMEKMCSVYPLPL